MSILRKLFTKEGRVEATTERTETELAARFAEVEARISAGECDVLAMLEEKESLKLQIQALAIAREKADNRAYRAKIDAHTADVLAQRDKIMRRVGDCVAALLLELPSLRDLITELNSGGISIPGMSTVEEILGVPADFADNLAHAIRASAPNTEWDYRAASPLGLKSERPKLKATPTYTIHGKAAGPPPGFSGMWDMVKGAPID